MEEISLRNARGEGDGIGLQISLMTKEDKLFNVSWTVVFKGKSLQSLPGRAFSALQLVCIMHAGFKRIEPGWTSGWIWRRSNEMAGRLKGEVEVV